MDPLEFEVTPDFNNQFVQALEDHHPRYTRKSEEGGPLVHPGLLVNYSNRTRSPSYFLRPGMATIHAKEEIEFMNPAQVGRRFRVTWKVIDKYERRGKVYSVVEIDVRDETGLAILKRRLTSIFRRAQATEEPP
jgi:hypothetical protein